MTAAPLVLPGLDLLWPMCLDAARVRRSGHAVDLQSIRAALWDEAATSCFELIEPLLDVPGRTQRRQPWVIGQLGQSLDGCVATHTGDSDFVNGPELLTHLHRLRALSDVVLVGAGTACIDDPQLTTRKVAGPNAVRVVLDPDLRLSNSLKVFSDRQSPTLLACDAGREEEAAARVGKDQVLPVPGMRQADGSIAMRPLLAMLAERGLDVVFVEGGGVTVSRFMAQGCMDRLHLSIAPVLIGDGKRGLQLPRTDAMRDCPRPRGRMFRMGEDMLWDLDLRRG